MEHARLILRSIPAHDNVLDIPTPPHQQIAVVINFLFPAVSLAVFSLRTYSRLRTRQWGWDDWLCLIALILALVMIGPTYLYIKLCYVGWHTDDVPENENFPAGLFWFYVSQMIYNPILAFVKASLLVFLLRMGGHKNAIRWSIHALNIVNAAMGVSIFFVALFKCVPIRSNWDGTKGNCVHDEFHVIASSLTILTDFLVLALPFWIFLGLNMRLGAKIAVLSVFLVGFVVIAVSFVRLCEIGMIYWTPGYNTDPFYSFAIIYSIMEVNLSIISASAPALRYILGIWFPRIFGVSTHSKYAEDNHHGKIYYNNASKSEGRNTEINLRDLKGSRHHTEIRSSSPSGSEEQIMTYNGIIRTMDVDLSYSNNSGEAFEEPTHKR